MRRAIATTLFLMPTLAHAGGFATADRSAGAMAVAGAATAREGEPGYNAAAASMRPGLSLLGGTLLARPSLTASEGASSATTEGGPSIPPHLYASYAAESWSAGLALSVPFGSQVAWPEGWARRFELVEARLSVLRVTAYGGWHDERFAVVAGVFLDRGSLDLVRALDFVEAEGRASIETRAVGVGATLSAFARLSPELDVGLSYTSRSSLALEGWADFSAPPELRGKAVDSRVSASITTPDRLALGGLWRPAEGWDVSLDLELMLWSTVDELVLDFEEPAMSDARQPRDWGVTVTPRLGASWAALEWLTLRGGVFVDPSPVPASTLGPSSPDSLRVGGALGAGLRFEERVGLDLGAQAVIFTGNTSAAGVSYGGVALLGGATLRVEL